jgi:hypothetical protein
MTEIIIPKARKTNDGIYIYSRIVRIEREFRK